MSQLFTGFNRGGVGRAGVAEAATDTVKALNITISGSNAGRVGPYVDYSELSSAGTHTFYIARTHGTSGAVDVDYASEGDSHTAVSGTLSWADGDASIKKVEVEVGSKSSNGLHVIRLVLSNPTNGLVLHYGAFTYAFGIIDDDTIAADSDAVFYDSAASAGGDGSQAAPFNDIYAARDAIEGTTKRFLYGRGTTVASEQELINYSANHVIPPQGRANEDERCVIMNWPGSTWTWNDGGGENAAWFKDSTLAQTCSYVTFRGIDFDTFLVSTSNIGGVWYNYGGDEMILMEHCTTNDLEAGSFSAAFLPFGVQGFRMWRCTIARHQKTDEPDNANTSGMLTYRGQYGSIQRCTFNGPAGSGVFHKYTETDEVSTAVRFCLFNYDFPKAIWYSQRAQGDPAHSFTIVEANDIVNGRDLGGIQHNSGSNEAVAGQHWWCRNNFIGTGTKTGVIGFIEMQMPFGAVMFNNIFYKPRRVWTETTDSSSIKPGIAFADYDCEFGTTYTPYEYQGTDYNSASALPDPLENNIVEADPEFTDPSGGDLTLQGTSPCINAGADGGDMGPRIADFVTIGA